METALLIGLAFAVVALAAVGLAGLQRLAWRSIERRKVLLVLADAETTISGVLWARRGPLLILRSATIFTGDTDRGTPADGEVVIERHRVYWMQVAR